jgi:hypothetical protein
MIGAATRIGRNHRSAVVQTGLFVIDIPPVFRSGKQPSKLEPGRKRPKMGNS